MKLLHTFPIASFALVLLSIVTFCAATDQVTFLLVTGAIAAASWYISEGPRGWGLPRWASHLLIILASLAVVPDILAHPLSVIEVLGRYTVYLALIKLYLRKNHRDYAQMLWLSLVLIVAAALRTTELLFGVALLLYAFVGLYVLLLYQMYAAHEIAHEQRSSGAPSEYRLVPPLRPVLGRTVRGQFVSLTVGLGVIGLLVSVVVFLVYPRGFGENMFSRLQFNRAAAKAGFVNRIDLFSGVGQRITDSQSLALEVKVTHPDGEAAMLDEPLYMRGGVLDVYNADNGVWSASSAASVRGIDIPSGTLGIRSLVDINQLGDVRGPSGDVLIAEVEPMRPLPPVMFAPWAPVGAALEHSDEEQRIALNRVALTLAQVNKRSLDGYRVQFDPNPSDATLRALSDGLIPSTRAAQRYNNSRVRQEAIRLMTEAGISTSVPGNFPAQGEHNRRVAESFENYFTRGFSYTLDLEGIEFQGDPIEYFLFDLKRGHCEFFASAMAAMCQSVNVEARVVTGFLASETDGNGTYLIRESNAHAWVEVRTGLYKWTRFDPTPASMIEPFQHPGDTLADRMRNIYDVFDSNWIRNITNYDGQAQNDLQQALHLDSLDWINDLTNAIGAWIRQFINRFGTAGGLQIAAIAAAVVVAVLIVIQLVRRVRRMRRSLHLDHLSAAERRRLLRQLGFYLDMLDLLRRANLTKPGWRTPMAHAEWLEEERPDASVHVRTLTNLFYLARFGGRELDADQRAATRSELMGLAEALDIRWRG